MIVGLLRWKAADLKARVLSGVRRMFTIEPAATTGLSGDLLEDSASGLADGATQHAGRASSLDRESALVSRLLIQSLTSRTQCAKATLLPHQLRTKLNVHATWGRAKVASPGPNGLALLALTWALNQKTFSPQESAHARIKSKWRKARAASILGLSFLS